MIFSAAAFSFDNNGFNASLAGLFQTRRVCLVADNYGDLRRRYLAAFHSIDQSHHIRPASGNEYS